MFVCSVAVYHGMRYFMIYWIMYQIVWMMQRISLFFHCWAYSTMFNSLSPVNQFPWLMSVLTRLVTSVAFCIGSVWKSLKMADSEAVWVLSVQVGYVAYFSCLRSQYQAMRSLLIGQNTHTRDVHHIQVVSEQCTVCGGQVCYWYAIGISMLLVMTDSHSLTSYLCSMVTLSLSGTTIKL